MDAQKFESLLRGQRNFVTHEQCIECGISQRQWRTRKRNGEWGSYSAGLVRVGGQPASYEDLLFAAMLRTSVTSYVCGPSAARLHGLWAFEKTRHLEILTLGQHKPVPIRDPLTGRVFRVRGRRAEPDAPGLSFTSVRELPCTDVPTTIVQLAQSLARGDITRAQLVIAYEHAYKLGFWLELFQLALSTETQHLPNVRAIEELVWRRFGGAPPVDSPAEAICDDQLWLAGMQAERQVWVKGRNGKSYRFDFLFRAQKLVVEVDGGTHDERRRRLQDTERDAVLSMDNYLTLRFSPSQVENGHAVAVVRRTLEARSSLFGVRFALKDPLSDFRMTPPHAEQFVTPAMR